MVGLGLKVTILTMPLFSLTEGWCFFSRRKYGAFKPRVEKVEGSGRVNAYIEHMFGYKVCGNHTFLNISWLLEIIKKEHNELLLSVKNL